MDYGKYTMPKGSFAKLPRTEYRKQARKLEDKFKKDALKDVGLADHPRANQIFDYAWDKGHAFGYHDVYCHLQDLSEMLLG